MKFRTALLPEKSPWDIHHRHRIALIGSCFAEHIGDRLHRLKFNVLQNPFGILYNPVSILNAVTRILSEKPYGKNELKQNGDLWVSFDHHGRFSDTGQEAALKKINLSLQNASMFFRKADFLFVSLGTAYVYRLTGTEKVVANCHKFPAGLFQRDRLTAGQATGALRQMIEALKNFNPELKIIFTVSPVRHIRDGLIENNRSKAVLHLAIEEVCNRYDHTSYFPSYELLIDDLRDYRFYQKDLIHPGPLAIDYIFNFFAETFFTRETKSLNSQIAKLNAAMKHRPFHPASPSHQKFVKDTMEKIKKLTQEHPYLNFDEDVET